MVGSAGAPGIAANSADLVARLEAWYAEASTNSALAPFEVLTGWTKAMGYVGEAHAWSFATDRVLTPWGATLTDGAELSRLIGSAGGRGNTWSRQLDQIQAGDDARRAAQARNERAWEFALNLLPAAKLHRSGRHPEALADALYVRGLVVAGMSQLAAARYLIDQQGLIGTPSGRIAQYRRVWRALGMMDIQQAA